MSSAPAQMVALSPHPDTRGDAVRGITARVARLPSGLLVLTYMIEGDLDRLRVPEPRTPRLADNLWQHTCCEIFIARRDLPAYHEFNFAPSGEWAAYAFERYRERAPLDAEELNPPVVARRVDGKLVLDTVIALDRLSPQHASMALSLALSAVVEDRDGTLSYWALKHPPGKPDFHHPDAFDLELT